MKKSLLCLIIAAIILAPAVSFAASSTGTTAAQQAKITSLQSRATTEINRRLAALNGLTTKVNAMKRLTSDEKASFDSDITSQISSLTALQTKIAGDSDLTTLKTDVQSIVDSYRIFALYVPKVHILAAADAMTTTATNLAALEPKLQTLEASITDPTKLSNAQTDYSNFVNEVADATTNINSAISAVINLTPDGYPGNKPTLQSAYAEIVSAKSDLAKAVNNGKDIVAQSK
jgi:hypothetical protein